MTPEDTKFLESLPEVPSSITQTLEQPTPSSEDVSRLVDKIVQEIAKSNDYAKIMSIYTTAQLYGKNCTFDSLMHAITNAHKSFAKQEHVLAIELLSKNIGNSSACIDLFGKLKKEVFAVVVLGYAASILSQQNS